MELNRKMSTNQEKHDAFDSEILSRIGKNFYLQPERADVYFVINSTGERIPAHKILLSNSSDVFSAMFYGSLKEEGDVRIVDASPEALKQFLQFSYFNKIDLSVEHVAEVMHLGHKYNVAECLRMCTRLLTDKITAENVVSSLGLALTYDEKELRYACESVICSNSTEVLQSSGFWGCDRRALKHILSMDRLSCSEAQVFEACMSWVRAKTKHDQDQLTTDIVQTYLEELFYEIRFRSISMDEFVKLVPSYGNLFSGEEYKEIIEMISRPEYQPKLFNGSCRHFYTSWNDENVIVCNRYIAPNLNDGASDQYRIKSKEVTTFSTNKAVLLGDFVYTPLYPTEDGERGRIKNVKATVFAGSKQILPEFYFDHSYIKDKTIQKLPKPIIIEPGVRYKIRLTFPSNTYTARNKLASTMKIKHGIVVEFHNDPLINGHSRGVIYKLRFNLLDRF